MSAVAVTYEYRPAVHSNWYGRIASGRGTRQEFGATRKEADIATVAVGLILDTGIWLMAREADQDDAPLCFVHGGVIHCS